MRPRNRPTRAGAWSPPRSASYSSGNAGSLSGAWFDGVTGSVTAPLTTSTIASVEYEIWIPVAVDSSTSPSQSLALFDPGGDILERLILGSWTGSLTDEVISIGTTTDGRRTGVSSITIPAGLNTIGIAWNAGATRYDILLNGVVQTVNSGSKSHVNFKYTPATPKIAVSAMVGVPRKITYTLTDATVHTWVPGGITAGDWTDTTGGSGQATIAEAPGEAVSTDGGTTWSEV